MRSLLSKKKSGNELPQEPAPKSFFSSSRKVAEAESTEKNKTSSSSKKLWNLSSTKAKADSPATVETMLKKINEENRKAEELTRKAEARADKAEARAVKAEERALKAEERAKQAEAKLENILDNVTSMKGNNLFCWSRRRIAWTHSCDAMYSDAGEGDLPYENLNLYSSLKQNRRDTRLWFGWVPKIENYLVMVD